MAVRQAEHVSLNRLGGPSFDDLYPGSSLLMRDIDRRQLSLMHGWGWPVPPTSVDWSASAGSSSYTLPVPVPPGVTVMQVGILASGTGTVTVTSPHDAASQTLSVITPEVSTSAAKYFWTSPIYSADDPGSALIMSPAGLTLWEPALVDVGWTLTASSGQTVRVHAVIVRPLEDDRDVDLSDAWAWAATHAIDLNGTSQYVDLGADACEAYGFSDGMTVCVWQKLDTTSGTQVPYSLCQGAGTGRIFTGSLSTTARIGAVNTSGSTTRNLTKTSMLTAGVYQHFAWGTRFDSTAGAKLWRNAVSQTPSSNTVTATDLRSVLDTALIGAQKISGTVSGYTNGRILEVAVFAGILRDAQVAALYGGGTPKDARRVASARPFLIDYLVASVNRTVGGVLQFPNLGLRPTYSEAVAVGGPSLSTDVP